ncbi:hypothetical protein PSTT_07000 [Puccinia striiformis]|uniref:STAS domain-containing protein n=1 Tax=Puccinia striiformis TaxID=27350 RepID=A0A2S4VHT5_9BASI|nr:hypothetical protein PSTT_07000 [Puccinia striiformis]
MPNSTRTKPLAISLTTNNNNNNNNNEIDNIAYSANQDDLRKRSNQLARLALRAETASITSSTTDSSSCYDDDEEDEEEEDESHSLDRQSSNHIQDSNQIKSDERTPFYFGHYYDTATPGTSSSTTNPERNISNNYGSLSLPKPISNSPRPNKQHTRKPARIARYTTNLIGTIPAVILGLMMNVLDGVSYGLIMFPTGAGFTTFDGFGGIGISMFFMTCIVSQLVYSLGGSAFPGGNGSMMIESVPFMHVIAKKIIIGIGPDHPQRIIATTMVSFALSSILTGIAFFGLGALKLGNLMGFFPRHILVGCIGSVGAFLIITGISVTGQLVDGFSFDGPTFIILLKSLIFHYGLPIRISDLSTSLNHILQPTICSTHIFPIDSDHILHDNKSHNRDLHRGVTDQRMGIRFKFVIRKFESICVLCLYQFDQVDWNVLKTTLMEQVAMVIFGLLHVPLNVPALALSLGKDDIDINKELIAHGISNTLAGLTGTVSNYLCYVNSVLFARVGGDSRLAGTMLAVVMMGVFAIGPGVIAYLPICVVGALIYVLGIDLLKEALWDTWGKVSWVEYVTIWAIIIAATWHDFVVGLIVGVLLACMSFVVTSSQHKPIRSVMDGCTARSTVRRHPTQHTFLKRVGMQTRVIKLQGHLFFGTISACEQLIKTILNTAEKRSIEFLVVDFSSTASIDFSAVEAFLRIHRLLLSQSIVLVICGTGDQVSKALRSVGLWSGKSIEVFEHLNQALEHCENVYLKDLYFGSEAEFRSVAGLNSQHTGILGPDVSSPDNRSPRRSFRALVPARKKAASVNNGLTSQSVADIDADAANMARTIVQPLPLLLQTLGLFYPMRMNPFGYRSLLTFNVLSTSVKCQSGRSVQRQIASYAWPSLLPLKNDGTVNVQEERKNQIEESMLPGTVAGDHTFLAHLNRNTHVTAETDTVLWKMDRIAWAKINIFHREIIGIGLLKMAAVEEEVLIGHLFTRFNTNQRISLSLYTLLHSTIILL